MAIGEPRYGVDPYLEWVNREGVPVVEDIGIDLFEVPVKPWDRFGCDGAAVHLKGRGDFSSMFLFEISKGGSTPNEVVMVFCKMLIPDKLRLYL